MSTFNHVYERRGRNDVMEAGKTRIQEEEGVMLSLAPITPYRKVRKVYQRRKSNSAEKSQDSASLVDVYDGVLTPELILDSAAAGHVSKRVSDVDLGLMEFDVGVDPSLNSNGSVDINVGLGSTFSLESSLNSGFHDDKKEEAEEFAEAVARISAKRALSWGDTPGSDVQLKASPTSPSSTEKVSSSDFNPLTPTPKRKRRTNSGLPKRKKHRPKIYDERKPKKFPKEKPIKKPRFASQKPKSAKVKKNRESSPGEDQQMTDHVTEEVSQVTNGRSLDIEGNMKVAMEIGDMWSQGIERNMKKSRALALLRGGALGASLTKNWGNYGTRSRGQYCWKPDATKRMRFNYNSFCSFQRSWKVNSCLTSIRTLGCKVTKGKRLNRRKRTGALSMRWVRFPDTSAGSALTPDKVQQSKPKGRKVKAQQADSKGNLKWKSKSTTDKNKVEQEHEGVALRAKELNFLVSQFKKLSFNLKGKKNKKKVTEKGAIVPYKHPLKVNLNDLSMKMWNQWMKLEGPEEVNDDEREEWEKETEAFGNRINFFINIMREMLGDRRFKPWKGSVVDSVVGVFLTQNVSDHLSSSAYLSLSATFPLKKLPEDEEDEGAVNSQESVGSNPVYDLKGNPVYYVKEPEQDATISPVYIPMLQESQMLEISESSMSEVLKDSSENAPLSQEEDLHLDELETQLQANELKSQESQSHERSEPSKSEVVKDLQSNIESGGRSPGNSSATNPNLKGKKKKVPLEQRDWDELRKLYSRPIPKSEMDSVDWEKVRHADVNKIAQAIKMRGQHVILGGRIKAFLNRIVKMHGSIDLEWLRHAPPDDVKQYLLEIPGIGLKSAECVRLLSLRQDAFPVDTNVGRIAVRLGWVPLEPLPGGLQFHLLEAYPVMDAIQKYLWPRLAGQEQHKLYELHYQMITFGKVFCTKIRPNCGPCPLKGICLYYASKERASQASLPAPRKNAKRNVRTEIPSILGKKAVQRSYNEYSQVRSMTSIECEPIIEEPSSPVCDQDIEDFAWSTCSDKEEEEGIYFFDLTESLGDETGTYSKELVLSQVDNSRPAPKLKNEERMRTEYQVYELPAEHELLRNFNNIEFGSYPYLFAVWAPGELPNSSKVPQKTKGSEVCNCNDEGCSNSENEETVFGTVMIPCRTATRTRFPLNGTYFQVNEVFADYESSHQPIEVRRSTLWNLKRRTLYFGSSTSSIYRDLEVEKIRQSFSEGYVCVRTFNRKTGFPNNILPQRFHVNQSERKKKSSEKEIGKGTPPAQGKATGNGTRSKPHGKNSVLKSPRAPN